MNALFRRLGLLPVVARKAKSGSYSIKNNIFFKQSVSTNFFLIANVVTWKKTNNVIGFFIRTDKASSSCPYDVEDELKFDCFPQGYAEEHLCLKRGCCWSFTDKQSVPFCYYPANYALYSFVNVTHLNNSGVNGVVGNWIRNI